MLKAIQEVKVACHCNKSRLLFQSAQGKTPGTLLAQFQFLEMVSPSPSLIPAWLNTAGRDWWGWQDQNYTQGVLTLQQPGGYSLGLCPGLV